MARDRLARILSAVTTDSGTWSSDWLRAACPEIVGVSGAGVMLMSGDVPRGSLGVTDEVSQLIEDLQYTLGEGPCVDAYRQDAVVAEPDLATPALPVARLHPSSAARRRAGGLRFPASGGPGPARGTNLYRSDPGPLTSEQRADALVVADVAARMVLTAQAAAPADVVAADLEASADFHFSVHNAAGIVSVQRGISISEALVLLRAYAFSKDMRLADVARAVIAHTLRPE